MARLRSATRPAGPRKNKNAAPRGRLSFRINIGKEGKGSIREGEIEKNLRLPSNPEDFVAQNGMQIARLTFHGDAKCGSCVVGWISGQFIDNPVPTADVPRLSLPGSFLASAMNSAMDLTGNEGCASSATGIEAIRPMGAKFLRGS